MEWQDLARRQAGAIGTQQLLLYGVNRNEVKCLVRSGRLARVRQGVYCLPGEQGAEHDLWVTLLAGGPGAVVWRRSAAQWWALDGVKAVRPEVAVGAGGRRATAGIDRVAGISADQITRRGGISVTSVTRTLCDLGRVCDVDVVERAVESALRQRLVCVSALESCVGTPYGHGVPVLRDALERRPASAPPTESDAETLFLQVVRRAGLPAPVRQLSLLICGRRIRLDAAWPARRLAVEIDGAATHATPEALGRDLRRQNLLVLEGWTVLRFTWEDVFHYPEAVIDVLLRVFVP